MAEGQCCAKGDAAERRHQSRSGQEPTRHLTTREKRAGNGAQDIFSLRPAENLLPYTEEVGRKGEIGGGSAPETDENRQRISDTGGYKRGGEVRDHGASQNPPDRADRIMFVRLP
jgi:hypothetical protein